MTKRRIPLLLNRILLFSAVAACLAAPGSPQLQAESTQSNELTEATVRELFDALSSRSFSERQDAHEKLRQLSADQTELLAELIDETPFREAAVRATQLLEDGYNSSDPATRRAASEALERMAYRGADDVRQIAVAILQRNLETRRALAIELLKELGAGIKLPPRTRPESPEARLQRRNFVIPSQLLDNQIRIHFSKAWKGTAEDLRIVERLKSAVYQSLVIYVISDSTIDDEQMARLQEVFDARVQQRGPVLLGIVADSAVFGPPIDGCLVKSVEPGSSADFGGILPQDRIVRVNDQEIRDFAELVGHLKEYEQGDVVSVFVMRPSTPEPSNDDLRPRRINPTETREVELSVKLTSWDDSVRNDEDEPDDESPDEDLPDPEAPDDDVPETP